MKKLTAVILAMILCFSLAGCGEESMPSFEKASQKSDKWIARKMEGFLVNDVIQVWGRYDEVITAGSQIYCLWEVEDDSTEEPYYIELVFGNASSGYGGNIDFNVDGCTDANRGTMGELHPNTMKKQSVLLGGKPVIYLYPQEELTAQVQIDISGEFTALYPSYRDGWTVTAYPDGTLVDPNTDREYYCLFWEGYLPEEMDLSTGFCVKGTDTAAFLEDALGKLGLTDKEANEFIIYWLPQMEQNPYNLISFQKEAYTEQAKLTVTPTPDTMIRVFMAWQGLDEAVEIAPQELSAPKREGFTVVEWGAGEIGK